MAEKYYERALISREKTLGPDDVQVAEVCFQIYIVHLLQRNYDKADAYYKRAEEITNRTSNLKLVNMKKRIDKMPDLSMAFIFLRSRSENSSE